MSNGAVKSVLNTVFDIAKDTAGASIAHKLLGSIDQKIGPGFESIKAQSTEDNNLFLQLLAKIVTFIFQDVKVISYANYQDMKTWFETVRADVRHADIIERIFLLLPTAYQSTFDTESLDQIKEMSRVIKIKIEYILLSPLYESLKDKTEDQQFTFIKRNFYDNLKEKTDPAIAVQEYVAKNPLSIDLTKNVNVFLVWGNFCKSLAELIKRDKDSKKIIYGYKRSHKSKNQGKVIHEFINDFINCIANQIKIETEKDLTGNKILKDTPVAVWMRDWLELPNHSQRLLVACTMINAPQHLGDVIMEKIDSFEAIDKRMAKFL